MRYFLFTVALLASFGAAGQTIGPGAGGGSGTVTSVANPSIFGVTCSVANATTVPAITCTAGSPSLGTATATSLNGLTITSTTGTFTLAAAKTLTVSNTLTFAGTDGSTLNIGTGGTLGSAAFVNTGTSGAVLGLLNGNLTFSGNDIFSAGVKLTGLSAGTQVSCLGLDSGNNVVLNAAACGSGGGGTPANPTATASDTAVNGSASTYMRSDAAPAVQKLSDTQFGLGKVDNITIAASGGLLSIRSTINAQTGTSYVVLSTDAGKLITLNNASAIAVTLPQAGTAGFGASFGTCLLNIGAGTATVTPTTSTFNLNASQALTTGTTMCPRSDGTNYYGSVGNNNGGSGSGTVSSGTIGQIGVYAATGTTISGQTVASGVILKGQGAAVPVASAITDNASNVSITEAALTTPVALTDGATIATNAALSNVFTVTLAGNRTLSNPTNLVAGQFITWQITQDATGGRTLAFGANFAWMSGAAPLLNSTANAKTTLSCFVDTTSTLQCAGGAPLMTVTTGSNCSSAAAPAVCGSASGGSIAVPTGTNPTLTVNTTAVTANSQILMNIDESLGTKLSVTCNTTLTTLTNPVVTARTAGTSFTVQIGATIAVNPACVSYLVVN